METPKNPLSLNYRLREGLARLATVTRMDEWNKAKALGINPTQLSILTLLEGRSLGMGVKEISAHLGVSQPTATDSINALERKNLVVKEARAADKRGLSIMITKEGLDLLQNNDGGDIAEQAVASLGVEEQQNLLLSLIKMIRHLQEQNAIPVQRMCVACKFFGPFAHSGTDSPHHCHFVDAAFGQRELRVDCREHEQADPAFRAATWEAFTTG